MKVGMEEHEDVIKNLRLCSRKYILFNQIRKWRTDKMGNLSSNLSSLYIYNNKAVCN
jgi:hypothetical protein